MNACSVCVCPFNSFINNAIIITLTFLRKFPKPPHTFSLPQMIVIAPKHFNSFSVVSDWLLNSHSRVYIIYYNFFFAPIHSVFRATRHPIKYARKMVGKGMPNVHATFAHKRYRAHLQPFSIKAPSIFIHSFDN